MSTPEGDELNRRVAQALGWTDFRWTFMNQANHPNDYYYAWTARQPDMVGACACEIPSYDRDLNAMHGAEKTLGFEECGKYHAALDHVHSSDNYEANGECESPAEDFWFHASAVQRAIAFLKAKGVA